MRDYGKISPQFWIGHTGRQIRSAGRDAQVLAAYLISGPHASMIGIYYLPMPTIVHETGIPFKGASKALQSLIKVGFCNYDATTEYVWVPEMARIQIADKLKATDKRVTGIEKELAQLRKCRFAKDFMAKYQSSFSLRDLPEPTSPIEGPSEPHRSQEQEQEQEQENEQEQKQKSARAVSGFEILAGSILDTPEFQTAWLEWQQHRREIKEPLKPTQAAKQLEQFAEWGLDRSLAAIRFTITMGWQGIREPDGKLSPPNNKRAPDFSF